MNTIRRLLAVFFLMGLVAPTFAYEHKDSLVHFVEYSEQVVAENMQQNKPYFLLFSAEWCYWCREFASKTLARQDVADYLNQNFVNVFVDIDIHNSAYVKYGAVGVPFSVFLNPDGSLYYKYAGTLYGDNFNDVIKQVTTESGVGKYALGMEAERISYTPPPGLSVADLEAMPDTFRQGVLENFDPSEYGVGQKKKSILPRTFLYLLEKVDSPDREEAVKSISKTLERAIDRIYDPIEGGFFRYAEKRNWQIPHYEKVADLNAATVLLLYQLNQLSPSPGLKQAADKTLAYLSSTLFDADTGVFLSFQVADTFYYTLDKKRRKSAEKPKVMDKVYTDRLAMTLGYLIRILEYTDDKALEIKVKQSLDFLAEMIVKDDGMKRYYATSSKQWLVPSGMSDHAYLARLFTQAATYFQDSGYVDIGAKVLQVAVVDFFSTEKRIFIDPRVDDSTNVEYLMEMNALFAQSIVALGDRLEPGGSKIVASLIAYFSQMGEPMEDRFWNAAGWEFTEAYVPYLQAVENYLSMRNNAS